MAITKLISPSVPNPQPPNGPGSDWDKAMAQLTAVKKLLSGEQMILTQWTNNTTAPALARGSYLQHLGAIYVVDTEDYALPALSSDGTYYIRLAVSGETLSVTYSSNIADYAWSAQHNGLYHADGSQVLPYEVVKTGGSIDKYKMINPWQGASSVTINYLGKLLVRDMGTEGTISAGAINAGSLDVTGAISGASLNTGSGAVKLYPLIFESVSVTATASDATVTISPLIIGQEVLVTATLTAANNYDAYVALPSGSEKYSLSSGGVVTGGTNISSYSITSGTPATVTRNILVKRLS